MYFIRQWKECVLRKENKYTSIVTLTTQIETVKLFKLKCPAYKIKIRLPKLTLNAFGGGGSCKISHVSLKGQSLKKNAPRYYP